MHVINAINYCFPNNDFLHFEDSQTFSDSPVHESAMWLEFFFSRSFISFSFSRIWKVCSLLLTLGEFEEINLRWSHWCVESIILAFFVVGFVVFFFFSLTGTWVSVSLVILQNKWKLLIGFLANENYYKSFNVTFLWPRCLVLMTKISLLLLLQLVS